MHTCLGEGALFLWTVFTIVIPLVSELTAGLAAVGLVFVVLCVTVGSVFVCCDGRDCWLGVCCVVCDCWIGACCCLRGCGLTLCTTHGLLRLCDKAD